ncbi:MAG: hypothetical protein KJ737_22825 [Proteobacteria bacterium]|nr:hypothetical protein [Pseudomonadota bacterium]
MKKTKKHLVFIAMLLTTLPVLILFSACDTKEKEEEEEYDSTSCQALELDFDYLDRGSINMALFTTSDDLWNTLEKMISFGPRHTASEADHNWVNYLEYRMQEMGIEQITRDEVHVYGHNIMSHPQAPKKGTAHHIFGILPGMTEEIIVLGVHSDGQNAVEENGSVMLLEIAEYLSKIPVECRRHTFALVFPTSHMAASSSWEAVGWALRHPEIMNRAVAFVAPEHVAFMDDDVDGDDIPFMLMATTKGLRFIAKEYRDELDIRMSIWNMGIGTAGTWWMVSGFKPTIGGMTDQIPAYFNGLFNPKIGLDHINKDVYYDTTYFFAKVISYMDGLSKSELRE